MFEGYYGYHSVLIARISNPEQYRGASRLILQNDVPRQCQCLELTKGGIGMSLQRMDDTRDVTEDRKEDVDELLLRISNAFLT